MADCWEPFYSWLIGGTHMMDTTNVCLFLLSGFHAIKNTTFKGF